MCPYTVAVLPQYPTHTNAHQCSDSLTMNMFHCRQPQRVGSMHLLYDEAAELQREKPKRILSSRGNASRGRATMLDITDRPRSAI
jgi:hypothetical protein